MHNPQENTSGTYADLIQSNVNRKSDDLLTAMTRLDEELKDIPLSPSTMRVRRQVGGLVTVIESVLSGQLEQTTVATSNQEGLQDMGLRMRFAIDAVAAADVSATLLSDQLLTVLIETAASARALIEDHMRRHSIEERTPAQKGFKIRLPQNRIDEDGSIEPTGNPIVAD